MRLYACIHSIHVPLPAQPGWRLHSTPHPGPCAGPTHCPATGTFPLRLLATHPACATPTLSNALMPRGGGHCPGPARSEGVVETCLIKCLIPLTPGKCDCRIVLGKSQGGIGLYPADRGCKQPLVNLLCPPGVLQGPGLTRGLVE